MSFENTTALLTKNASALLKENFAVEKGFPQHQLWKLHSKNVSLQKTTLTLQKEVFQRDDQSSSITTEMISRLWKLYELSQIKLKFRIRNNIIYKYPLTLAVEQVQNPKTHHVRIFRLDGKATGVWQTLSRKRYSRGVSGRGRSAPREIRIGILGGIDRRGNRSAQCGAVAECGTAECDDDVRLYRSGIWNTRGSVRMNIRWIRDLPSRRPSRLCREVGTLALVRHSRVSRLSSHSRDSCTPAGLPFIRQTRLQRAKLTRQK